MRNFFIFVINIIGSIIGTVLDTIIIKGLSKDNPIDNDNNVVFKIGRAYLHLFNLIYLFLISICSFCNFFQFHIIFASALYIFT